MNGTEQKNHRTAVSRLTERIDQVAADSVTLMEQHAASIKKHVREHEASIAKRLQEHETNVRTAFAAKISEFSDELKTRVPRYDTFVGRLLWLFGWRQK